MAYELKHRTGKKTSSGKYFPLGAKIIKKDKNIIDVNFAIYSQNAKEVFLLLFDLPDGNPTDIIKLENKTKDIWYITIHGLKPRQLYAYKMKGDYNPSYGLRFNENKLLIDPYAKALTGKFKNIDNLLLAYDPNSTNSDLSFDMRDNSNIVPKCIVIEDKFDWGNDEHPDIPFEKSIIYEVHLKGFTAHPSSNVEKPGTYQGFIEKIPHLKELGINAVELLPIQEFYVEDFLLTKNLTNYWGYNTIGFFTPESSYASIPGKQVEEFKNLIKSLHKEGIEIIMDVVYNHTGEGSEMGPTMSFRGIDNSTYYSLHGDNRYPYRFYQNYTGCGNSLNISNPQVIRLVMDSLRYWVEEMHVDGFRFDLASVLGRDQGNFEKSGSFFDAISQDPVLNRIKLIAEPWDIGTYQVGNFPIDWSEWNGRFRDTLRRFTKGDCGQLKELGWRITGSADLYGDDGRSAYNSVNFITCHDGFTLNDLVLYDYKHNEANLEENRDGSDDNNSWNCGVEGETKDENLACLRKQMIKNHIISLIFSSGTPMILGGDEFLRTQKGNNNAYCQDNEISWIDWDLIKKNSDIFTFFKKAIAFTKKYTILQRRKFFQGRDLNGNDIPDIQWFGTDLTAPDWNNPEIRTICYQLDGTEETSDQGEYYIFIIYNADFHLEKILLPQLPNNRKWHRAADTSLELGDDFADSGKEVLIDPPEFYLTDPRSTVVLLGK
jgi:glycogen operon protein